MIYGTFWPIFYPATSRRRSGVFGESEHRAMAKGAEMPIKRDNLSYEMREFYKNYYKESSKMNEIDSTEALISKLKEGEIPKLSLKFIFDDGSTYLVPIVSIPENVKLVGFNHVPTFETVDGLSKLMSEIWCVDVGYGEGVEL